MSGLYSCSSYSCSSRGEAPLLPVDNNPVLIRSSRHCHQHHASNFVIISMLLLLVGGMASW